jgi:aminoglycoside 6'-N-acetyltransferase
MTAPDLRFRPLTRQDFDLLSTWMSAPHVERWWREETSAEALELRYGPAVDDTDRTECFIVQYEGEPIGFVQRYRIGENLEWQRSLAVAGTPNDGAGIDYFIGVATLTGQGLGPEIIDRFVAGTWTRYTEVPAIVVSVDKDNHRSWRALEKAGFLRVWTGFLVSEDPSDEGLNHVYVRHRPDE